MSSRPLKRTLDEDYSSQSKSRKLNNDRRDTKSKSPILIDRSFFTRNYTETTVTNKSKLNYESTKHVASSKSESTIKKSLSIDKPSEDQVVDSAKLKVDIMNFLHESDRKISSILSRKHPANPLAVLPSLTFTFNMDEYENYLQRKLEQEERYKKETQHKDQQFIVQLLKERQDKQRQLKLQEEGSIQEEDQIQEEQVQEEEDIQEEGIQEEEDIQEERDIQEGDVREEDNVTDKREPSPPSPSSQTLYSPFSIRNVDSVTMIGDERPPWRRLSNQNFYDIDLYTPQRHQ